MINSFSSAPTHSFWDGAREDPAVNALSEGHLTAPWDTEELLIIYFMESLRQTEMNTDSLSLPVVITN